MFFHVLTFAGFQGRCLNTRSIGRVLKHTRGRDPASVNMCDRFSCIGPILPYSNQICTDIKISLFLHWISIHKMASAVNLRTS